MAVGTQPGDFVQFDVWSLWARGTRGQTQLVVYLTYTVLQWATVKLPITQEMSSSPTVFMPYL